MSNFFSCTMNSFTLSDEVSQLGGKITTVELSLPDNNTTNYQEVRDFCKRRASSIRSLLESAGLRANLHSAIYGNTIDLGSDDSDFGEFSELSIAENIDFASAIGARDLIIHSKYKPECNHPSSSKRAARYLIALERLLHKAEKTTVRILVENVSDPDPAWLNYLMKHLPSEHLAVCIDTGHVNYFGKKNLNEMISGLSTHIVSYHIHDNDGSGDQHQHPQAGTIMWPEFVDSVKANTPDARLNLELFSPYTAAEKLNHINALKKWFEVA